MVQNGASSSSQPQNGMAHDRAPLRHAPRTGQLRALLDLQDKRLAESLEEEEESMKHFARSQTSQLRKACKRQARMLSHLDTLRHLAGERQQQLDEVVDNLRALATRTGDISDMSTERWDYDRLLGGGNNGNSGLPLETGDGDFKSAQYGSTPQIAGEERGVSQGSHSRSVAEAAGLHDRHQSRCTGVLCREAAESSWLRRAVTSTKFERLSAFVIISNAIFVGYSSEYAMDYRHNESQQKTEAMMILEIFFFSFYVVELLAKFVTFRMCLFTNSEKAWNIFDFSLVALSAYDMMVLSGVEAPGAEGSNTNITWMRLLRLLKMLRMLRTVRMMRFFRELRMILRSIVSSMRSLLWSSLMLGSLMYIFALFFLQATTTYLNDNEEHDIDLAVRDGLLKHWGSVQAVMLTLFKVISGGEDWAPLAEFLNKAGGLYYGLFLLYTAFFAFAVLNVITGIFVDAAMSIAQLDRENVIQERIDRNKFHINALREIFKKIDTTKRGAITWKEFERHIQDEEVRACLNALDLNANEAHILFQMLNHGTDRGVTVEDFVSGSMRLKGSAKNIDFITLRYDTEKYMRTLSILMSWVEEMFAELQHYLKRLDRRRGSRVAAVEPLGQRLKRAGCPLEGLPSRERLTETFA